MQDIIGIMLMLAFLGIGSASAAETGIASVYWIGDGSQNGTVTACGPPLRDSALTAAHKTLPCGTKVRVTNTRNGKQVSVTITDRGPYSHGRIIDLTKAAAAAIGINGIGPVSIERE